MASGFAAGVEIMRLEVAKPVREKFLRIAESILVVLGPHDGGDQARFLREAQKQRGKKPAASVIPVLTPSADLSRHSNRLRFTWGRSISPYWNDLSEYIR